MSDEDNKAVTHTNTDHQELVIILCDSPGRRNPSQSMGNEAVAEMEWRGKGANRKPLGSRKSAAH